MRASISRRSPRALAVCDRCNFNYNHDQLQWQWQWRGPRLENLHILVCPTCLDKPQPQLKTVILPPDPVPITSPRPDQYVSDMDPNSPIGQSPDASLPGTNIGTLIAGGGTWSAFDGRTDKPFALSAYLPVGSQTGFDWIGKDWAATSGSTTIASTTPQAYTASSFTATAPNNSSFLGSTLATSYTFQGSSDAVTWTALSAVGTTTGAVGETVTSDLTGGPYRYHRFLFLNNLTSQVAVAQLEINTDRASPVG